MQFKIIPAFLVFIGSYLPLSIILFIQNINENSIESDFCLNFSNICGLPTLQNPFLAYSILLLTLSCFILSYYLINEIRCAKTLEVIEVKPIPNELISYSFPYIVSFMGFNYSNKTTFISFLTFFFWLFLITYKAGQIVMNPLFIIFGWNLFEAKAKINNEILTIKILSKTAIYQNRKYKYAKIQGNFIIKEDSIHQ